MGGSMVVNTKTKSSPVAVWWWWQWQVEAPNPWYCRDIKKGLTFLAGLIEACT